MPRGRFSIYLQVPMKYSVPLHFGFCGLQAWKMLTHAEDFLQAEFLMPSMAALTAARRTKRLNSRSLSARLRLTLLHKLPVASAWTSNRSAGSPSLLAAVLRSAERLAFPRLERANPPA